MDNTIIIVIVVLVLIAIGISIGISYAIANNSFLPIASSASITSSTDDLKTVVDGIKSDIVEMKKNTNLQSLQEMVKKLEADMITLKTQISTLKAYDKTLFDIVERERVKIEEFAKKFPMNEDALKTVKDDLDNILASLKSNLLENFSF